MSPLEVVRESIWHIVVKWHELGDYYTAYRFWPDSQVEGFHSRVSVGYRGLIRFKPMPTHMWFSTDPT